MTDRFSEVEATQCDRDPIECGSCAVTDEGLVASLDFAHLFSAIASPMAVVAEAPGFEFVAVNDSYCEMMGRSRASLLGRSLFAAFPGDENIGGERAMRASFRAALTTGTKQVMALQRYDVDNGNGMEPRYWSITNTPIIDPGSGRHFVLVHPEEVTSFVQQRFDGEAAGVAPTSAAQTRAVTTVFSATIERLQYLNDLASALVGASTVHEVARALLRDGLGLAGAVGGSVIAEVGDRFEMLDFEGLRADTAAQWKMFPLSPGVEPFSDAITSGEPLLLASRREFVAAYPALVEHLGEHHQAWAVLPLRDGDRTLGAIGLLYGRPIEFDHARRLVLYTIASLTSQAMSRARLLSEQTVAIASIDRALLDMAVDDIDGLDVSGLYEPASQAITAGGDWFDVLALSDTSTLVIIGDIANHGPVAVGEMAHARAVVQALALGGLATNDIAAQTSVAMARFADSFATATIMVFDHDTRVLTWTSAGHPAAVVVPSDPELPVALLDAPHGTLLGLGTSYTGSERLMSPGDQLVLYTDGLLEDPGVDLDEALGTLVDTLDADRSPRTARELFEAMRPSGRHVDDIAIVTLRLR